MRVRGQGERARESWRHTEKEKHRKVGGEPEGADRHTEQHGGMLGVDETRSPGKVETPEARGRREQHRRGGRREGGGKGRQGQVQREYKGGKGVHAVVGRVGRARAEPREASAWKGSQPGAGGRSGWGGGGVGGKGREGNSEGPRGGCHVSAVLD